jgi:hypothetical protein
MLLPYAKCFLRHSRLDQQYSRKDIDGFFHLESFSLSDYIQSKLAKCYEDQPIPLSYQRICFVSSELDEHPPTSIRNAFC